MRLSMFCSAAQTIHCMKSKKETAGGGGSVVLGEVLSSLFGSNVRTEDHVHFQGDTR